MLLLDTCVCIDFLRGAMPNVLALLRTHEPSDIAIPTVVEAELKLGALKSAHPDENMALVEQFLVPFESVPFDSAAAAIYARIRADLERRGMCVGPNDLLIAATARAHSATLVTNNVREFKRVEGLRIENWAEASLAS
ncbi:type II toxin-antitoxin system tRNA(fMet)-specific endonuclease VapC [Rubneribacter sp.]